MPQKVFIHTQGCSANLADSETMSGILQQEGYELVANPEAADLVVLNTCTVKNPTEGKALSFLKKYEQMHKKIIVAGCIPQADPTKITGRTLVGTRQVHQIAKAADATIKGDIVQFLDFERAQRLELPKFRINPLVEIIPINQGCLGSCTFCLTKKARGTLQSYDQHSIIRTVLDALEDGAKEIWLTSQDTGAYGLDLRTDLPSLLQNILAIDKDFKLRIGMGNPDLMIKMLPKLIPILHHKNVYKFLHLPLQSGSNAILRRMQRFYTREQFTQLVTSLKNAVPQLTIATDVICGFPGESQADFEQTYTLLEELKIPIVNVSKFYPRPGTKAMDMKKVSTKVVKERSSAIMKLQRRIITNQEWMGYEGNVFINEQRADCFVGKNDAYRQVIVKGEDLLGKTVRVKITHTTPIDLRGVLLS